MSLIAGCTHFQHGCVDSQHASECLKNRQRQRSHFQSVPFDDDSGARWATRTRAGRAAGACQTGAMLSQLRVGKASRYLTGQKRADAGLAHPGVWLAQRSGLAPSAVKKKRAGKSIPAPWWCAT